MQSISKVWHNTLPQPTAACTTMHLAGSFRFTCDWTHPRIDDTDRQTAFYAWRITASDHEPSERNLRMLEYFGCVRWITLVVFGLIPCHLASLVHSERVVWWCFFDFIFFVCTYKKWVCSLVAILWCNGVKHLENSLQPLTTQKANFGTGMKKACKVVHCDFPTFPHYNLAAPSV